MAIGGNVPNVAHVERETDSAKRSLSAFESSRVIGCERSIMPNIAPNDIKNPTENNWYGFTRSITIAAEDSAHRLS